MKPPDSLIASCPLCQVPLVIPVRYEYPERKTIVVIVDREFIRRHAELCVQHHGGGDGDVGSD